jgi:hypothetical protein
MSVDCNIKLPANVRINDVSKVMGLAAGLKGKMEDIGHYDSNAPILKENNSCVVGIIQDG